jgi:hypothetical protein
MTVNLKKAMKHPAPESMLSELGLDRNTTISGLIEHLLKRLHALERSRNTVEVGTQRIEVVEKYGDVELNDDKLRAICQHAWPSLEPEERDYLNAIGLAATPKGWSPETDKRDLDALFVRLVGTPEEIAKRDRLRQLAYTIVARTATREELTALVIGGVIDEPKRGDIVVPDGGRLQ